MSYWNGRAGKGAGRERRIEKREEAEARQATARRRDQHGADYHAGYEAYLLAEPTPADASQSWRNGWERALSDERGETAP